MEKISFEHHVYKWTSVSESPSKNTLLQKNGNSGERLPTYKKYVCIFIKIHVIFRVD